MSERFKFFFRNLIKGLLYLGLLILLFILARNSMDAEQIAWLAPVYTNPTLVYIIFIVSEVVFGIIPPEVFFIWALREESVSYYITQVAILAAISYAAGIIGFFFGRYLNKTILYRWLRRRFLGKYQEKLRDYGFFLVLVAALTPVPFSAIAILTGAVGMSPLKYMLWSLARFLRFGVYAWFIWQANMV
ncbi:MAG: VTT domain-containing protein [Bacteroidia bacterium]